jgi:hypothetical protein
MSFALSIPLTSSHLGPSLTAGEARRVRAAVVPNAKRETLQNAILNSNEHRATIY